MEGSRSSRGVAERTLDVLEAIGRNREVSLIDLATACGLPPSTAHRLLLPLQERGYVLSLGRGRYCLGSGALRLSERISWRALLADVGRRHVRDLARSCHAHAHLGIFEDDMVTYLVKHSTKAPRIHSFEGAQLEAYCSGIGKVLLAYLPTEEQERYLAQGELIALTPRTIVDFNELRSELELARTRGWAIDDEEGAIGLRCLATPVFDDRGQVIAAVSISIGTDRSDIDAMLIHLPRLQAASAAIGAALFPQIDGPGRT